MLMDISKNSVFNLNMIFVLTRSCLQPRDTFLSLWLNYINLLSSSPPPGGAEKSQQLLRELLPGSLEDKMGIFQVRSIDQRNF